MADCQAIASRIVDLRQAISLQNLPATNPSVVEEKRLQAQLRDCLQEQTQNANRFDAKSSIVRRASVPTFGAVPVSVNTPAGSQGKPFPWLWVLGIGGAAGLGLLLMRRS